MKQKRKEFEPKKKEKRSNPIKHQQRLQIQIYALCISNIYKTQ